MTIKKRALIIGLILIGLTMVQTLTAAWSDHQRAQSDTDGERIVSMLRNHMFGDMMHDAVRGAVFAALYGAAIEDPAQVRQAKADLAEFSANYRRIMAENLKLADDGDVRARLEKTNQDVEIYLNVSRKMVDAAAQGRSGAEATFPEFNEKFETLEGSMEEISVAFEKLLAEHNNVAQSSSLWVLIGLALLSFAVLGVTVRLIQRTVIQRLNLLAEQLKGMAGGDYASAVGDADADDEIGEIARSAEVFREVALAKQASDREQQIVVGALANGLLALAERDLSHRIAAPFAPEYETLRENFNRTATELSAVIMQVASAAESVATGSNEIHAASSDLAKRNELQAAKVDQTSASMGEVASVVQNTAGSAKEAERVVQEAHGDVLEGSEIVRQAVETMASVQQSSQEVTKIISLIEGIAFQTNLLALNAGVEAARAGETGRGFAVVANEVRALAQRSAEAAQDITGLITASTAQVNLGVTLVGQTGDSFAKVLGNVGRINEHMHAIVHASQGQADSLQQVNLAAAEMGRMTQQNAAMVEQATAAARGLAKQSSELTQLVAAFKIEGQVNGRPLAAPARPHAAAMPSRSHRSSPRAPAGRGATQGNLALATQSFDQNEDWGEF